MVKKWMVFGWAILALTSCFKEDDSIPALEPFQMEWHQELDSNGVMWVNVVQRNIQGEASPYQWDLSFDCAPGEFGITLNKTKGMSLFNTRSTVFDSTFSSDVPWIYNDQEAENRTETLLEWGDFTFENPQSYSQVYLIDRGVDANGNRIGLKKFQVIGFKNDAYLVKHANLDGTGLIEAEVLKSDSLSHVQLSLSGGGKELVLEPKKETWHLCVSPYLVKQKRPNPFVLTEGVSWQIEDFIRINAGVCEVAVDSQIPFDKYSYFDALNAAFSVETDAIGSQWYAWNSTESRMEVNMKTKYILRIEEAYYLIQFIDYSKENRRKSALKMAIKSL